MLLPGFVFAVFLAIFWGEAAQAFGNQASAPIQTPLPVSQPQKDTLIVGSEQDYPPFATGMTDATVGGFTVDLWKAVAAESGLNYRIHVGPFREIFQQFKDGKIDVLINLAQSVERHPFTDFTVLHVVVHSAIFVRKSESGICSEDDFAGKSIIVLNADQAHDYALSKGWERQLVLVDTAAEGLRLLASGKHDTMLLSKLAGMQTLQTEGQSNIEALKAKAGFSQKFAFAVDEGSSELLGKVNMKLWRSPSPVGCMTRALRDLLKYLIPINDTLGHDVGDLMLKEVAQRIQACLRESDTVARVDGDEFIVLLPPIDMERDALGVAEKSAVRSIRRLIWSGNAWGFFRARGLLSSLCTATMKASLSKMPTLLCITPRRRGATT